MFSVLSHGTFARLFAAQCVALVGTGLLTVALGLLAYDLAGDDAGAVLGAALSIKMAAFVGLAPIADAIAARLPRKAVLIGADIVRASVAVFLPFIDAVWQIYVLIFVLQAASATFTPAFQATIPDLFEDEGEYTKALALSRIAYDIENLMSPALAGLLLLVMGYHWLFIGTVLGFLGSAVLVKLAAMPERKTGADAASFGERASRGVRLYLATPRLRGLLALTLAAASASAFVLVNTVVLVRSGYGGSEGDVALALAAYGFGSMTAAWMLPRVLERHADRPTMLTGAIALTLLLLALGSAMAAFGPPPWPGLLAAWALLGFFYSTVLTPSARLLRRSADPELRPPLFAAQFALSHACWLVGYAVAGWAGAALGLPVAMLILAAIAVVACVAAAALWPSEPDHSSGNASAASG